MHVTLVQSWSPLWKANNRKGNQRSRFQIQRTVDLYSSLSRFSSISYRSSLVAWQTEVRHVRQFATYFFFCHHLRNIFGSFDRFCWASPHRKVSNLLFPNPGVGILFHVEVQANMPNLLLFLSTGVRAEEWRHVCLEEELEMTCPPREVAIQNKEYKSLSLIVTDPYDASLKQYAVYCGSDPANCTRYPLKGSFVHRIKVRNPVRGKMYVIHLRKNDLLSYTCSVQLKKENRPLVYQMNVSSSVNCK